MANVCPLRQTRLLTRTKEKLVVDQEPKRNCCDGGVDRISSLPDKAISKILVCLPIKEAVGTSKLSTTWRYRWMSIPELVFDEHAYAGGQLSYGQRVSFINSVLLLHDGDITKFEIIDLLDNASMDRWLDQWLLLLSRKKLTDLLIQFKFPYSDVNLYACHSCVFYCQALSTLKLKFCRLELPLRTRFNGFKNLTVLDLEKVDASNETIEFLVNTSPLLENLSITLWKPAIWDLNISAPNLRKCAIHNNIYGIITFVKTPELMETDISLGIICRLRGIVGGLVKIQKAAFSYPYMESLSENITYHHLNHLKLEIDFGDLEQVLAALWLSKSSPTLKTIDIKISNTKIRGQIIGCPLRSVRNVDAITKLPEMYELLDESKDVLQSLETFELEGFGGTINELRFIQFFLLHASVLQKMKIGWKIGPLKREETLMELVQFQRASFGVKINLYDLKK